MGGQQMSTRKNSDLVGIILKKTAMPINRAFWKDFLLWKRIFVCLSRKKRTLTDSFWLRGRRDLNPRTGCPAYQISSLDSSTTWVRPQRIFDWYNSQYIISGTGEKSNQFYEREKKSGVFPWHILPSPVKLDIVAQTVLFSTYWVCVEKKWSRYPYEEAAKFKL